MNYNAATTKVNVEVNLHESSISVVLGTILLKQNSN